ncbi:hypothetical protein BACUNI_03582 [Bacteroides uniformis ATCC 8492]|uniref:Uncharacterized protein n=1 Tax=Bacteroides uniformis (strain ATCC 8492 / DSM 6597 / CCUG 4942 / CIP 103695 / JCM 5828 / KCTC 5204 / NCTC 13054 / VPI 0061) TaxID=411479 RepID=A0ABC9N863_BACUC|nr:hypothetical protein BACUNI_03582 [Bacteroides uniformis ATCC 8492]
MKHFLVQVEILCFMFVNKSGGKYSCFCRFIPRKNPIFATYIRNMYGNQIYAL